ncbi:hypothetical protein M885DRAFT_587941 [Pelagophyceae sp. CCMP2097]|nr:hypothetical protein M885DRAFT_587941 [Pelagophyceae sp. CCMP2097]|mmetsp:Transcript_6603/g.21333  ORF Transcript_6603/g.21333 Transcript_6603/m.21333 type:complete len:476 (+) Transcript_6603:92-1519(+)
MPLPGWCALWLLSFPAASLLTGRPIASSTGTTARRGSPLRVVKFERGVGSDPVEMSVRQLEDDFESMDEMIDEVTNLKGKEVWPLAVALGTAASFAVVPLPLFMDLAKFALPAAACLVAAVGGAQEYGGAVAAANAHEVAAIAVRAAAEAEAVLSTAERAKAILPVCVVVSATASALSLVAGQAIGIFEDGTVFGAIGDAALLPETLRTSLLLVCPGVSILAASVAVLAKGEAFVRCDRAQSLGRRRFATRENVGRTWRSTTELVVGLSNSEKSAWIGFARAIVAAPLIAALITPSDEFGAQAATAAAAAAVQAAYSLTLAEYRLARAGESVAAKSRTAAVAEAYADQAKRANARIPYASALAALCAAVCTLCVEMRFPRILLLAFPLIATVLVTSASRQRNRAIGDAQATAAASNQLAGLDDGSDEDPLLPLVLTWRNLKLALGATLAETQRLLDEKFRPLDPPNTKTAPAWVY